MAYSKITSKGQITIPISVRRSFNLKTGDKIDFQINNGEVKLVPAVKTTSDVFGILSKENQQPVSVEQINLKLKKSIQKNIK